MGEYSGLYIQLHEMRNIRGREKLKLAVAMTITICVAIFVLSYKHDQAVADHEILAEQVAATPADDPGYWRDPAGGEDPKVKLQYEDPFERKAEDPAMNKDDTVEKKSAATANLEAATKHAQKVLRCLDRRKACKNLCAGKKCKKGCKKQFPHCHKVKLEVELLQEEGY